MLSPTRYRGIAPFGRSFPGPLAALGLVAALAAAPVPCATGAAFLGPELLSAQVLGAPEVDTHLEILERELNSLSEIAEGVVGVGVIHLETGRELYLNGDEPFPMASTYKVPIAVELLRRVDAGELRLDSMVAVRSGEISPGSGLLSRQFQYPGVSLSLRNLTELMLLISDNSATDMVLRIAGGPEDVTERMRALGIDGVRVDRSTTGLIADYLGMRDLPPETEITPERFSELLEAVTEEEREVARTGFDADPRDTATPAGMARLLELVWRGEAISRSSSDLLLDIMRRSTTGTERIKGRLPRGTEVSHKTGTVGTVTNDVGIIHLPHDAGNVVTVVFVKESEVDVPQRERAIAEISRAVYDYFIFHPEGM